MAESKSYSTGETAKLIGVSFRTLQRWLYSGKIIAVKMPNGRYRIQESEITRILETMKREIEEIDKLRVELTSLVKKKEIAYLRELQVNMEYNHLHENTYEALEVMAERGKRKSIAFKIIVGITAMIWNGKKLNQLL